MQTIRIFISSPGDVADERQIAGKVIERLQGKYWSFVRLDDVFWEQKVIRSTAHYQDELVNPAECEMVVGILWSRLGSLMPEKFRKASGERYQSGTEWELEMAFDAYEQSLARTGDLVAAKPDIVIYRRNQPPPQFADPEQATQAAAQITRLDAYFRENFWFPDGTIKRPITNYATLDEFEAILSRNLEELILRQIPGLKPGFEPPPISGSPFKGLHAFNFADSDRYFGRNREIREIQQRLIANAGKGMPFILIYGGSGYGKSSLMRAGLAPVLTRPGGSLDGIQGWRRVAFQPAKGNGSLCERFARSLIQAPPPEEAEHSRQHRHWPLTGLPELAGSRAESTPWDSAMISRYFSDDDQRVFAIAAVVDTLVSLNRHLLLEIDQLEELFTTSGVDADQRAAFLRTIGDLCLSGRVWVVATMRSEFFPRVAEQPELYGLVGKDRGYILPPPDRQSLREIIRYPVLAARLDFERRIQEIDIAGEKARHDFLHDQILADSESSPDALPLLEFTLQQLYESRCGTLLTWEAYAAAGGLKGAIAKRATQVYQTLGPVAKEARHRIFAALVHIDATRGTVTRQRTSLDGLKTAPGLQEFLDSFLAAHLLVTDEDAANHQSVVTLAHEALISHWDELSTWIQDHQGDLIARQRLREQTQLWIQSEKKKTYLLSEARLAEAQRVSERDLFSLSIEEVDFLNLSQQRSRKKMRTLQIALVVFALIAVTAVLLGVMAKQQTKLAEEQTAVAKDQTKRADVESQHALSTLSQSDLRQAVACHQGGQSREAVAFLARAVRSDPANRSAMHMLWSLQSQNPWSRPLFEVRPSGLSIGSVEFSPDAKRLTVAYKDGKLSPSVYDLPTGLLVSNAPSNSRPASGKAGSVTQPRQASIRPRISEIATPHYELEFRSNTGTAVEAGGNLIISDPKLKTTIAEIYYPGYLAQYAFSPYDRFLLTLSSNGTARVFDLAFGKQFGCEISSAADRMTWAPDLSSFALWNVNEVQLWSLPHQDLIPSLRSGETGEMQPPLWTSRNSYEAKLPVDTQPQESTSTDGFATPLFIAASPAGDVRVLVSGQEEGHNVLIWDSKKNEPIKTITVYVYNQENGRYGPEGMAFSPKGDLAVFAGGPGNSPSQMIVYNTSSWEMESVVEVEDMVSSACFSPDGSLLAASVLRFGLQYFDWRSRLNISGARFGDNWGDESLNWSLNGVFQFGEKNCARFFDDNPPAGRGEGRTLAALAEALAGLSLDDRSNFQPLNFPTRLQSCHAQTYGSATTTVLQKPSSVKKIKEQILGSSDAKTALELLASGYAILDPLLNALASNGLSSEAREEGLASVLTSEQFIRVAIGEFEDPARAEKEAIFLLSIIDKLSQATADGPPPVFDEETAQRHRKLIAGWAQARKGAATGY